MHSCLIVVVCLIFLETALVVSGHGRMILSPTESVYCYIPSYCLSKYFHCPINLKPTDHQNLYIAISPHTVYPNIFTAQSISSPQTTSLFQGKLSTPQQSNRNAKNIKSSPKVKSVVDYDDYYYYDYYYDDPLPSGPTRPPTVASKQQ